MNVKQFFYKGYYEFAAEVTVKENGREKREHRSFKLGKSADKKTWDEIKDHNVPLLQLANKKLVGYQLSAAAVKVLDFREQSGLNTQTIVLRTTYPGLFTGSGYNHETGNEGELSLGFFFDHCTGLPILPGSSVKGVLRSVFPNFKDKDVLAKHDALAPTDLLANKAKFVVQEIFGLHETDDRKIVEIAHQLEIAIFQGVDFKATLEARRKAAEKKAPEANSLVCHRPMVKHDIFLEAYISNPVGAKILGTDAITPHNENPLKNPVPLPFLKVLPDVEFTFQFLLQDSQLADGATITVAQKQQAFAEILKTFGAGAKTNVGYGQFASAGQNVNSPTADGSKPPVGETPQSPVYKPVKRGEVVSGVVVEDANTPPGHIAFKLYAGDPADEIIAYLKFGAGRPIGTKAEQILIEQISPKLIISVRKW